MTNTTAKLTAPRMRCLIVDDEENAIDGIVDYLEDLGSFEIVGTCLSALEAMEVLKKDTVDLMFLDINMPRLTGLELLETLQNPPLTILTTAYSEFALEGYRLNVVDYLLKPYTFQRFVQATQKAVNLFQTSVILESVENKDSENMFIRQGDTYQKIDSEEILFAESMQNYVKLHLAEGKTYVIHQTMISLEEVLSKQHFFRIHNSYLVNITHINKINGGRLYIGDKELPISRHRREEFLNSVVYKGLISK